MKRNAATVLTLSAIAAYISPFAVSSVHTSGLALSGSFPGTDTYYENWLDFGGPDARPVLSARVGARHFDLALRRDNAFEDAAMTVHNFSYSFAPSEFNWHFASAGDKASQVPEPASLALMGISLAALGFMHRKKRG